MDARVRQLIVQAAIRHGVDPQVALRVATAEGGIRWGAVGDNGSSFGPFQLHVGGALPKGKNAAWANSPAGIDYALRGIAQSAAGLHGQAGVAAAVRGFERPADPASEIVRAMGGNVGGTSTLGGSVAGAQGGNGGLLGGTKQQVALALLQAASQGGQFTPGTLLGLAMARKNSQTAADTFGPGGVPSGQGVSNAAAGSLSSGVGWLGDAKGLNGNFMGKLAAAVRSIGGTKIKITSGLRSAQHNQAIGGATNSNHLSGHAADGYVFIPKHGWVPLGEALQSSAGKFGLRSGASFNWGGKPDIVHVDDGYNQH